MTDTFTPNYKLTRTTYDTRQWQDKVNDNFTVLDAVLGNLFVIGGIKGVWKNATEYQAGDVVIDPDLGLLFQSLMPHVSSAGTVTFAEERVLFPTRWAPYSQVLKFRGIWTPNTLYNPNEFVLKIDGDRTRYVICLVQHLSSSDFEVDLAAGKWQVLVDNLVSFLQTGTGAIARQMQDKMRDVVSVMDFIPLSAPGFTDLHQAIRDSVATTDLTPYINNALAAHHVVLFPYGRYVVNGTLISPIGTRVILGAGVGGTLLLANHIGTVIEMEGAATDTCILGGMTIHANDVTGPTSLGVDVVFPSIPSWPYKQFIAFDLEFRSDLSSNVAPWPRTWERAFRLENVWNPVLENISGSSYPDLGNSGATGFVEIVGDPASASLELRIHNCNWNYGAAAILGSAYIEGLNVTKSSFVGCTNGLHIPSTTPVGGFAGIYRGEAITFSHTHIAAWFCAINLDKVDHFFCDTCDMQRHNGSTSPTWSAYSYNDCNSVRVEGGSIAGNTGVASPIGLVATGTTSEIILMGVNLENLATPFSLGAGTTNAVIKNNNKSGLTTDAFAVGGAFHKIEWLNSLGETVEYSIESNHPIRIFENVSNGEGGSIDFRKARAGLTVVQSGDILGDITAKGHDGTDYETAAIIRFDVSATPSNNDMPGRVSILVTPDGSTAPADKLVIDAVSTDITTQMTVDGRVWATEPETAINNAGNVSLSAAQMLNTVIVRFGGGTQTDTMPTAAALVAAVGRLKTNSAHLLLIQNLNTGVLTLANNTGVTLTGTTTIVNGQARLYLLIFTNVGAGTEAVTLHGLMQGVI